ncbi:hypothetical protein [Pseudoalteromonas sp.]|uniref:hypothetical protein n=1 Tax=Pseudoalteromonas sp. TaxID=53249 RepID=UPI003568DDE6
MKIVSTIGFLLCFFSANSSAKSEINFYDYSIGVSYQNLTASDYRATTDGPLIYGGKAHAIGLYYKGEPHPYLQFATGLDYMYMEDTVPFVQMVKNEFTGQVSSKESTITGFAMYAETGLKFTPKTLDRLSIGILGGYRYNNIERSVFRCDTCENQELNDFESSMYAKGFIEYQLTQNIHIQFNYSNFFAENGFENAFGLHISVFGL